MRRNRPHPFRDLNGNWYKDNEDFERRAWRKVSLTSPSSTKNRLKKESDVKLFSELFPIQMERCHQ